MSDQPATADEQRKRPFQFSIAFLLRDGRPPHFHVVNC